MSLQNLNELATKAQSDFNSYHKEEIILSPEFKEEFSDILKERTEIIYYSKFTSVVETSSHLTITFPNQWFFIASYFIDYFIALKEYKKKYSDIFQGLPNASELVLQCKRGEIPNNIITRINEYFNNPLDEELFKKFLSNYDWWFGSKTIDRGDFFISSILNLAKVVNASQGYIADLTNYLSKKPGILDSLYKSKITQNTVNVLNDLAILFDHNIFQRNAIDANLNFTKNIIIRFTASLLTKPFVILTGLSGSGKTKLAQAFAMWLCENENQYCIVPVGADWTNREPLLGFLNALNKEEYLMPENGALKLIIDANDNPTKPYFLILDEMNLSHVERYFADFLSVMESKGNLSLHAGTESLNGVPPQLQLPHNLFIIGTVNIDETTYMFSPKVLDRASVIEFRVTADEMKTYLENNTPLNLESLIGVGAGMANSFVSIAVDKTLTTDKLDEIKNTLLLFFSELKKTGSEFGYRSAAEIIRFAAVIKLIEPTWEINQIIDAAIMQKLLPKVHGSRRKLEQVLKALGKFCIVDGKTIEKLFEPNTEIAFANTAIIKYPISLEKIIRMYKSLINNGFTSYAEA